MAVRLAEYSEGADEAGLGLLEDEPRPEGERREPELELDEDEERERDDERDERELLEERRELPR